EGLGAALDPQPRPLPDGAADQRVVAEALVEAAQIVVDADGEPHAGDRLLGDGAPGRLRAEEDTVGGELADAHDRGLVADMDEPVQDDPAPGEHAVAAAAQREPEGPDGPDLDPVVDHLSPIEHVHVDQEGARPDDLEPLGLAPAAELEGRPARAAALDECDDPRAGHEARP